MSRSLLPLVFLSTAMVSRTAPGHAVIADRQANSGQYLAVPPGRGVVEPPREPADRRGEHHADRDRLAVRDPIVLGSLDRVAQRVPVVK